jgi:peptidoglycan/xylan/chitin deacetylase (PgdA/CDA1 family)
MFRGKKLLLSRAMNYSGGFTLLKSIRRPNLYVLNYHRIFEGELNTNFNHRVFNHSKKTFVKQMKWLKANFDLFSEADLLEHLAGNKPLKRRTVMITFDDGYIDNYTIAFPILKEMGIPATYFIPYSQIDRSSLAWWDLLAYFAKHATAKTVTIKGQTFDLTTEEGINNAVIYLCWEYKTLPNAQAKEFLKRMHHEMGLEKSLQEITELSHEEFMTWEQVKEVSDNGVTIGSHTMSHQILSNQTPEDQYSELADSKRLLEEKLGQKIQTLAYPVGKAYHFTEETKALTDKAGYKAAFSFITGYSKSKVEDKLSIPRFELLNSTSYFKAQTLMAGIFTD